MTYKLIGKKLTVSKSLKLLKHLRKNLSTAYPFFQQNKILYKYMMDRRNTVWYKKKTGRF